ncbi:methionyl-tRNA formyltransferase [Glaciecola sp. MH2013]|uniref:methionyl-tRNA formyltransferase n=1 Tax=Glaciecola sp. MH2013 TaxID=2785524 RepID=UPI00189E3692|nr:methionyl-tRNA formyltransferase [Glaciecola sp. MH2013]MBF7074674.1 methionyl-tRNA formyltransferase [Glaciecola sp. MH2013]
MATSLKIIFAGTPDFAAKHLQALLDSEHEVVAVYSQPDRPAGRGKKLSPSAVKVLAQQAGCPIYQPESLKTQAAQEELAAIQADIMIVVAYGLILPAAVLHTPRLGCLNVHGSLLPKWRGAAPIQRAIWAGDKFTGVSVMQMDEGLDTGPVLLEKSMVIPPLATSASLYDDLAELGPEALIEAIDNIENLTPVVQDDSLASYANKLSKEEAKVNWQESAAQLARNVRAFNPWPMVWFEHKELALKVHAAQVVEAFEEYPVGTIVSVSKEGIEVAAREHNLLLTCIQIPGKKAQEASDIINGKPDLFIEGELISSAHQPI